MTLTHRLFAQSVRDMRAMPAADVEAAAAGLLSRLLDHAARHVPFYRPMAGRLLAAAADREAWEALPVIPAGDRAKPFLASELPPQDCALDECSWTTLSTPVEGPFGLLADVADKGQWEYLLRRFEVDTAGRLAAILPPSVLRPGDLAEPFGPWSFDAQRGRGHRWSEAFAPEATLLWLGHIRPACLFLRPAMLEMLLGAARPGSLMLTDILLAGPALRSETRTRCTDVFGARLIEAVVSEEAGFVAGAEPTGLFVPALETALVEIVDDSGAGSRPGEPGRLVATALYGYRRVVIRHDLGLRAAWTEHRSVCGRRCFRVLPNA